MEGLRILGCFDPISLLRGYGEGRNRRKVVCGGEGTKEV